MKVHQVQDFVKNLADHLQHDLTHTGSQVNELHLAGDWRDRVDHLVDQIKTGLAVNLRCERLVLVQGVRVADGVVVHLDS